MQDDTFIFLDEFSDTELYVFLNKSKEKILKFIWKEKKIEIIGKYQEQQESNYSNEEPFDLAEIGYDSVVYKVLSKIEEDDLKSAEFEDWDGCLVIEISIYNYPDEIRKYLCKHFPNAKNAYISRVSGTKDGDIGVENASPDDIITALEKARFSLDNSENIFNLNLMLDYDLVGKDNSSDLRALLGAELGIGYSNGKQFMAKLNRYGISLEEIKKAYEKVNKR